ncbi:biotin transporter BioY [Pseudarthrobacter sp. J1738]|uniref:biotin transporter BioY n=1 Tax=unclassified Pseudarthrobacter TaxID=2647000 RepID=UPI003D2A125B
MNTVFLDRTSVTDSTSRAKDLALIAVFAAIVAASVAVPGIPLGGVGVPITLQTFAVLLTGMVLGGPRAFAAVCLYVLLGLAGVPIFSMGRAGLGVLAGPSAGYIIAFPFAAALAGFFASYVLRRGLTPRVLWLFACGILSSILLIHTLGSLGIAINTKATLGQAFLSDLVFYPGDVIKNILAAVVATALHRAFPDVLVQPSLRKSKQHRNGENARLAQDAQ